MMKGKKILVALLCMLFLAEALAFSCTTIIVGKDVSSTGMVLVGHNEDDEGRIVVDHSWVSPASWQEGSVLPAESKRALIPQVTDTFGFYWVETRNADGGLSAADTFLNENGVLIVSNSCASSKESSRNTDRLTDGGIEYNLRRIVAERAESARDAVDIIIDMVETYGYVPSGRAYTVADRNEAWVVQIVSGKHYVAARCPDNQVVVIPNHYTIHDVDALSEITQVISSPDLVSYAVEKGWWDESRESFDFAEAYQAAGTYKSEANTYRQKYAQSLLMDELWNVDEYPFCITPSQPVTPQKLQQILSYHYEGQAEYDEGLSSHSPGLSPHDTTLRRICTGSTIESIVCEFTGQILATTLWTAFGRGCELPYVPLHPLTGLLPAEMDTVEDPASNLAGHLKASSGVFEYRDTGWQKFRDFEGLLDMVYKDSIGLFTASKLKLESEFRYFNSGVVKASSYLASSGEIGKASELLAQFDRRRMAEALDMVFTCSSEFAGASVEDLMIDMFNVPETVKVVFTFDEETPFAAEPVESSVVFGMGFQNTRTSYARAVEGTLSREGENAWSVEFDGYTVISSFPTVGTCEHFLGGNFSDGTAFAGICQVVLYF